MSIKDERGEVKTQEENKEQEQKKQQARRFQPQTGSRRILKKFQYCVFGANNNFFKLISKKGLKDYCNLGKLIKQGTY